MQFQQGLAERQAETGTVAGCLGVHFRLAERLQHLRDVFGGKPVIVGGQAA